MYFVMFGEYCIRYTGTEEWDEEDLPESAVYFDYDNELKWTMAKLKREAKRLENEGREDSDAALAIETELKRRQRVEEPESYDSWDEVLDVLEEEEERAWEEDVRRPLIYPGDLSLPTRKLIREAAAIGREEIALQKKTAGKPYEQLDQKTKDWIGDLEKRGWEAREALLDSDIGQMILDMRDPVEDMKTMAAQLLFLYAHDRTIAETGGRKPDEDFFYAGSFLYEHAVFDQLDEEEEDYSASELDEETAKTIRKQIKSLSVDDKRMLEMDMVTRADMLREGFDLDTLSGCRGAQKWLKNAIAELDDTDGEGGPSDRNLDLLRYEMMLWCVEARIQKLTRKN